MILLYSMCYLFKSISKHYDKRSRRNNNNITTSRRISKKSQRSAKFITYEMEADVLVCFDE